MALTVGERDRRIESVRRKMREQSLAALIISGSTSRKGHFQYLTNYNIPIDYCYMLLPLDGDPTLFVFTPNQARIAPKRSWVSDARHSPDYGASIAARLRELGADGKKVGVVGMDVMSARTYQTIIEILPCANLVDAGEIVAEARTIKNAEEIDLIRESAVMADGACAAGRGAAHEGARDYEVFAEMDYFLKRHGVIEAFNLVTADTLPAFPYLPVSNVLKDGDAVLMEITPRYQGYYAQLTVGAVVGQPNPERLKMVQVAQDALEKGIEVLRPGTRASNVDASMRAVVEGAGYAMPQRAGHGVGLEVDEPPALIPSNQTLLQPGMTVVVHPSVVIPGKGGVFMGGTFLITPEGHEKLFRADLI
ncbi:MAG: aminopeptidase P family protein [Deltaproteobacteria bacterium]|nr:aminopeptidase P family protein [Deltaproteobacteria bacterium]